MKVWEDARVIRGMRAQLEMRRKRLERGDAPLGWKVGFAAPDMLKRLGISGPLVGFLTRNALVRSGATVSLAGWTKPVAEPEIAVRSRKQFRAQVFFVILQRRGALLATAGTNKALRPTPLQQKGGAARLIGKRLLKLRKRSALGHCAPRRRRLEQRLKDARIPHLGPPGTAG